MMEQLLEILKEGRAVTLPELAMRLRASEEEVQAGIEFLMQAGYLEKVSEHSGCGTGCSGCSGCSDGYQPEQPLTMWKCVKLFYTVEND